MRRVVHTQQRLNTFMWSWLCMVMENIRNHTRTKKGGVASIPDAHPLYSVPLGYHRGKHIPNSTDTRLLLAFKLIPEKVCLVSLSRGVRIHDAPSQKTLKSAQGISVFRIFILISVIHVLLITLGSVHVYMYLHLSCSPVRT